MQHRFAAVQMLDELGDAAAVEKLFGADVVAALIGQNDFQTLVEKRQLAQALRQRVEIELRRVHDGRVGLERDFRAGLARLAGLRQRSFRDAAFVILLPGRLCLARLRDGASPTSALTQLTPTPCRPPETLYVFESNLPPACSLVSTTCAAETPSSA